MPNELVVAIAQNKKTFDECRIFLAQYFNSKDKVISLENSSIETCLPYYIYFLESKNINILEALNYFQVDFNTLSYWQLLKVTIIGIFRKLENNDLTFTPF